MKRTELPESELVRKTFTLRVMDLPPNIKLTKRSLLRWFALSFGLLSEKESRTTVLDVLDSLFYLALAKKIEPSTLDVQKHIKDKTGKLVSEKLIRYHLNRLKDLDLLLRKKQRYSFNPCPTAERTDLKASFNHYVSKPISKNLSDLEDVFLQLSQTYKK
ncbi:MAG: hypothetical protein AB1467_04770 [Candidatus Diapherotrites archaeon]